MHCIGDHCLVERMRQTNCNLGGEESGHIIFLDCSTTGNDMLSAIQVLAVMLRDRQRLSELKQVMERYPQKLLSVRVANCRSIEEVSELVKLKEVMGSGLGPEGCLLIRPCGTEPMIRVTVEGADTGLIEQAVQEMASSIEKSMG